MEDTSTMPAAVHMDHMYAKPPKTPEAQNEPDDVEINEEDEKRRREELLTAQARQHTFPSRSLEEDEKILYEFQHGYGPDTEDVDMFKLALSKLKGEKDELVNDVPWAFYPSDILTLCITVLVI